jgi:hypothetical protein
MSPSSAAIDSKLGKWTGVVVEVERSAAVACRRRMAAQMKRAALITGAGSGIGASTARALAAEGVAVALAGRRRELLEEIAAEIEHAIVVAGDITVVRRASRGGEQRRGDPPQRPAA